MRKIKYNLNKIGTYIILHILMFFFSLTGICAKIASNYDIWKWQFILYYSLIILIMVVYTFGWQRVIKKFPLTVAYSSKAVTVIWAGMWGTLLFDEKVSMLRIISYIIIIFGIVVYVTADKERDYNE